MNLTNILLIINSILLFGIVAYIIALNKYLNKNDIVDYVAQIFKISKADLKQELFNFLKDVKEEYTVHQHEIIELLNQQKKEAEKLKEVIEKEGKVFMIYLQERVEAQEKIVNETEKRLQELQKELFKTQNILSKCKKKLERLQQNDNIKT